MPDFFLRLARQWIAGKTLDDGIRCAKKANTRGVLGLLNLLGEHATNKASIEATKKEYFELIDKIDQQSVKSQISVKPSQLGLGIDYEYCLENYYEIADHCSSCSNWLWIDMEDSRFTSQTVEIYKRVLGRYPNTGIAMQSCLKRTERDVGELLPLGAKIRLVKGAYNEAREVAFKGKQPVSESFRTITRMLFEYPERNFFAIATHDAKLVDLSRDLSKEYRVNFEFEMLMGVRNKLKAELVKEMFQVREYIPYGPEWLAYSMRRLREKKSNILLLGRSLFSS